jgi:hypothetical protein
MGDEEEDETVEVSDEPMGVPPDADPDDAEAPGLPESEPPNAG